MIDYAQKNFKKASDKKTQIISFICIIPRKRFCSLQGLYKILSCNRESLSTVRWSKLCIKNKQS